MPQATVTQTPTNPVTEIETQKYTQRMGVLYIYGFEILLKESVVTPTYLMIFSCTIDTYINKLKSK